MALASACRVLSSPILDLSPCLIAPPLLYSNLCASQMMGVAMNQAQVVEVLLRHGALVDQTDERGVSSLALSVQEQHVECAALLLNHGANSNKKNSAGVAPLYLAAHTGNLEIVDLLLAHGADPKATSSTGGTPLHAAVRTLSTTVVERLLAVGADPNAIDCKTSETPLLSAIKGEYLSNTIDKQSSGDDLREAIVALLLANSADANLAPEDGETPLSACAVCGALRLVRRLLEASADVNALDSSGSPPLLKVAQSTQLTPERQSDLAAVLLAHGALVNGGPETPLQAAVKAGRLELVRLLLLHDADPNAIAESQPVTPLRLATSSLDLEPIANELEAAGAIEPCDAVDIASNDDAVAWLRAMSLHHRDDDFDKVIERVQEDALRLFSGTEEQMHEAHEKLVDGQRDSAVSALWWTKLRRQTSLQRDREQRAAVSDSRSELPPFDNEAGRLEIVDRLRNAAATYARAEVALAGPEHDEMQAVTEDLDVAVDSCMREAARLREVRATWFKERYQALQERWATLDRALEMIELEGDDFNDTAWRHRPEFFETKFDHLRIRAAAARPVLYGALAHLLDRVNTVSCAPAIGLSRTLFALPFADDNSYLLTMDGKRAAVVAKPTLSLHNAKATHIISAGVSVEDPYVMAVVLVALSAWAKTRALPLGLHRLRRSLESVSLLVVVEYPKNPQVHTSIGFKTPFDNRLAGKPLMTAEIKIAFGRLDALTTVEAPYAIVAAATNKRQFIFSKQCALLDPDTWQPVVPSVVLGHQAKLGRDLVDSPSSLEAKLGQYAEALAAAKMDADAKFSDLKVSLEQRTQELSQTRADLVAATHAAIAREDEVRKLKDELDSIRSNLPSPSKSQVSFDKPAPPPKNKSSFPTYQKSSRNRSDPQPATTSSSLPALYHPPSTAIS